MGTSKIDTLAVLAEELTEAEENQESVPRRQQRANGAAAKRKALSPGRAERKRGAAAAEADEAPQAPGKRHSQAGRRVRGSAKRSVPPAVAGELAAKKELMKQSASKPKRPKGRPRKMQQPMEEQNAAAAAAAEPAAVQPAQPRVAAARQVPPGRIAHPPDPSLEALVPRAPAPRRRPVPRPPARAPQAAARNRVVPPLQPTPSPPPRIAHPMELLALPLENPLETPDGEQNSEASSVSPLLNGRQQVAARQMQLLCPVDGALARGQAITPASIVDWASNQPQAAPAAPVGPAAAPPLRAQPTRMAPPAAPAAPAGLRAAQALQPAAARPAAGPAGLGGAPALPAQPRRRIAHAEMLGFGPLAPRVPKASEPRTVATRARECTDDENSPAVSGAAAAPAAQRNLAAAAAGAGQQAAAAAAAPAAHNRVVPSPGGSSATDARLALDPDMALGGEEPHQNAPAGPVPDGPMYPGSHPRNRQDRTRSLSHMALELPEVPEAAAPPQHDAPGDLPDAAPAAGNGLQPQTPAGLPALRAEIAKGKRPMVPQDGNATEVEAPSPNALSVGAAWQLAGMAGEAGPSHPPGIGDGSEGQGTSGEAGIGKEPSPKKRLSSQGTYRGPSPQKCLRMQAAGRVPSVSGAEEEMAEELEYRRQQEERYRAEHGGSSEEEEAADEEEEAVEEKEAAEEDQDMQEAPQQEPVAPAPRNEAGPSQPLEGHAVKDRLNQRLLQRLAEEAALVIEAQQAASSVTETAEGLEHLEMQLARQQGLRRDNSRMIEVVSIALQESAETSKRVQETTAEIERLQELLRGQINACERARVKACTVAREHTLIKEDLAASEEEVAGVLRAQPAHLQELDRCLAAQRQNLVMQRAESTEAAWKLQAVRNDKERLLRQLESMGGQAPAASCT